MANIYLVFGDKIKPELCFSSIFDKYQSWKLNSIQDIKEIMDTISIVILAVIGWIFGAGMLYNKIKNVEEATKDLIDASLETRIENIEKNSKEHQAVDLKEHMQLRNDVAICDQDIKHIMSNYVQKTDFEKRFDKLEEKIDANFHSMMNMLNNNK